MFGQFAAAHLGGLDAGQLDRYEALLDEPDQDVLAWVYGRLPVPARHDNDVFALLRRFEPARVTRNARSEAAVAEPAARATATAAPSDAVLLANAPEGLEAMYLAVAAAARARIQHPARRPRRRASRLPRRAWCASSRPRSRSSCLPAWDCLPYDRISPNAAIMAERLRALVRLAAGPGPRSRGWSSPRPTRWCRRCRRRTLVRAAHLRARAGGRVDRDALLGLSRAQRLPPHQCGRGGRRLRRARRPGRYLPERPASSRCGSTSSARRWNRSAAFDPLTQRSLAKVDRLELMPVSEVLLDAGGDRAVQEPAICASSGRSPAIRCWRRSRPAAPSPAWSTGCRCSIRTWCR